MKKEKINLKVTTLRKCLAFKLTKYDDLHIITNLDEGESMKNYYAMITPGTCSDWGELILIDSTVGDFARKVAGGYFQEEKIEQLKKHFTPDMWKFLKSEFKAKKMSDADFAKSVSKKYENNMSDNYYLFSELKSTLSFNSVTEVIDYVQENNIKVIGDLS